MRGMRRTRPTRRRARHSEAVPTLRSVTKARRRHRRQNTTCQLDAISREQTVNGSIQHRPDRPKPWRAKYWAPDGKQKSKTFTVKSDAEKWLRSELRTIDLGTWIDPAAGMRTYAEWSDAWLAGLDVKPKTRAGYESLLRSRVLPRFGTTQLRRITPPDVRSWVADMATEGLSPSRIRQARQVLRASLEQAVADGILAKNPTAHVKVPADRPREQLFLRAEQVSVLAEAAEARQAGSGLLIRFLAYSGLRWGEAVALKRSSLDLLRRRVHVRESATEVNGRLVIGPPKSHRSRTVVLPRFLVERLAAHLAEHEHELVFTAPAGGYLRVGNFRKQVWLPATAAVDVPNGLRVHDLRHTAASLAISAGASLKAVQTALGHASPTITLDRYAHLYQDDLEALADAMHNRWADADVAHTWPKPDETVRELAARNG